MNVFLWVLQILLALHTAVGAWWKLSNSEETVPSLKAIPHVVWKAMIGIEIVCSVGLIATAYAPIAIAAPIAATVIATLVFCGLHVASDVDEHGSVIYWLVVAAIAGFIAYGRFVLEPIGT